MGIKFSKRVENTVEKEEIARYEQFLLFPRCFQKTFTTVKVLSGKKWSVLNTEGKEEDVDPVFSPIFAKLFWNLSNPGLKLGFFFKNKNFLALVQIKRICKWQIKCC